MEPAREPGSGDLDHQSPADQSKKINSSHQVHVSTALGALTLGVVIGIAGTLGVLRHQLSKVGHWKKESAVANELLRERFIADTALHELSISQLLKLSDEDFARIAHTQILGAYSSAAEVVRTPPIEDGEIEDRLDYLEEALQELESTIAKLEKENEQGDPSKERALVHSLGMTRHASLQSVYAMYKMGNDRPASATDEISQKLLRRFVTLHERAISLFEDAFSKSHVYTEPFEQHNLDMLRGRKARATAFVNKDDETLQRHSLADLGKDFQSLTEEQMGK